LLWRHPSAKALKVVRAKRCRLYDPFIRHIDVHMWRKLRLKKAWTLPRLDALTCVYRGVEEAQSKLATTLAHYAPKLASLTLQSAHAGAPATVVGDGCDMCTADRCESILKDIGDHCGRRLVSLKLDLVVTLAAVRRLHEPLGFLRTADVVVEAAAAASFCGMLPQAEELRVHVAGGSARTGLLAAATRMAFLRELRVSSCGML
jgi:hypothetical protein